MVTLDVRSRSLDVRSAGRIPRNGAVYRTGANRSERPSRPVTPEVAGSSPVAPVTLISLQISILRCLSRLFSRSFGQQTGSTMTGRPHRISLQNARHYGAPT